MTALIWSTFGDRQKAKAVTEVLLKEKQIGCANIFPEVHSVFEWNGEISEETEVAVLFKTDARLLGSAVKRIEELHPYETPAIVGWLADKAGEATGRWLGQLVGAIDAED